MADRAIPSAPAVHAPGLGRAVAVLLVAATLWGCGTDDTAIDDPPDVQPRPPPPSATPPPEDPPEPPPPGWPNPVVLGVYPTELDADALIRLDARLSAVLPVRVRTAVLRDSPSLGMSLAADRISFALLEPLDAVGVGVALEGLPQAVYDAGLDKLVVWVGAGPQRWCPAGADAVVGGGPGARALRACTGLAPAPPSAGAEPAEAPPLPADGEVLVVGGATSALSAYVSLQLGDDGPPFDAVDLETAQQALDADADTLVALPLAVAVMLDDDDERPLVVIAWGPRIPNPLLVPAPGVPEGLWHAFERALAEVMESPHGAQALLDTLDVEGWVPVRDAVVDQARAVAGRRDATVPDAPNDGDDAGHDGAPDDASGARPGDASDGTGVVG